ncbi:hypothetical protein ACEPAF_7515 [Sanghuangporus sanghuang]
MTALRHTSSSSTLSGNPAKLRLLLHSSFSGSNPVSLTSRAKRLTTASTRDVQQLPQQTDLLDVYRGLVAAGRIRYDEDQIRIVMQLRRLSNTLRDYAPPAFVSEYYQSSRVSSDESVRAVERDATEPWYSPSSAKSTSEERSYADVKALVRLRSQAEALAELRTPKGLLLTGPPGCGKSFLVDLWFSTLPTPFKTRKHYSELVLEIYRGVWEETRRRKTFLYAHEQGQPQPSDRPAWTRAVRAQWQKLLESGTLPKSWRSVAYRGAIASAHSRHLNLSPISFAIAHRLVTQHWLLAFDELQLLDVSSAGLLADVLSWYWRMGGVVVASSNKVPDDLYRGGVQRERLEPFVEALKARCPILEMPGKGDWRREKASNGFRSYWFTKNHEDEFWACAEGLTTASESSKRDLSIFGRKLIVPHSTVDVCRFTFSELCDESLGPADYISIAAHFRTVIITSIPILKVSAKNQSRRFISLIDALYEARCRVIALADAEPDELFFPDAMAEDSGSRVIRDDTLSEDQLMAEAFSESREGFRPNISSYADKPERPAASPLSLDSLSIFSGEEERFAYKRAVSRLIEMTSEHYAKDNQWDPLTSNRRKWERINTEPIPSNVLPISVRQVVKEGFRVGRYVLDEGSFANDFAAEATGEGEVRSQQAVGDRPSAPRLAENHFWGVREDWGDKAGRWGKGAAAFDAEKHEEETK